MKKILNTLLIAVAVLALAACSTVKSTVSKTADLGRYKYVAIVNTDQRTIPPEQMEYNILIFDAIESSGLQLVSDLASTQLSNEELKKLLVAHYGVPNLNGKDVITVTFTDYMSGRPIATFHGKKALGITQKHKIEGAIKNVGTQIGNAFRGK